MGLCLEKRLTMEMIQGTVNQMPKRFRKQLKDCYLLKYDKRPNYESLRFELKRALAELSYNKYDARSLLTKS